MKIPSLTSVGVEDKLLVLVLSLELAGLVPSVGLEGAVQALCVVCPLTVDLIHIHRQTCAIAAIHIFTTLFLPVLPGICVKSFRSWK